MGLPSSPLRRPVAEGGRPQMRAATGHTALLARLPAASRELATLRKDDTPARLARRRSYLRCAVVCA
jgi:hypothetical protein